VSQGGGRRHGRGARGAGGGGGGLLYPDLDLDPIPNPLAASGCVCHDGGHGRGGGGARGSLAEAVGGGRGGRAPVVTRRLPSLLWPSRLSPSAPLIAANWNMLNLLYAEKQQMDLFGYFLK
jgi:hypothetical protein